MSILREQPPTGWAPGGWFRSIAKVNRRLRQAGNLTKPEANLLALFYCFFFFLVGQLSQPDWSGELAGPLNAAGSDGSFQGLGHHQLAVSSSGQFLCS